MGFSRQEYWSELPFPSPVALPDPGFEPRSPVLQAVSLPTELFPTVGIPLFCSALSLPCKTCFYEYNTLEIFNILLFIGIC